MRTGNQIAMFRTWGEALMTMLVVFVSACLFLLTLFALWAIGNEVGQFKVWVPLVAFAAGVMVTR